MTIGLDIGYNAVKAVHGKLQATFPSTVGTADTARFAVGITNDVVIDYNETQYLVGESAIAQSRMLQRREDRHWFKSDEYTILLLAALSSLNASGETSIVTGLPVAFYATDKDELKASIEGDYTFKRNDKEFHIEVVSAKVIPQPFGTLLDIALDDDGEIADGDIANGNVGIVDCGGKTTNLLSARRLGEIAKETASVNVGGWDVIRALRDHLANEYPNRDFRDHELAEIVKTGKFTYFGEKINVAKAVSLLAQPLASQVIAQASQLWNGGAALDRIIVTGGGANLLGSYITDHFPHAEVTKSPVFGNASGYYKLGTRNERKQ